VRAHPKAILIPGLLFAIMGIAGFINAFHSRVTIAGYIISFACLLLSAAIFRIAFKGQVPTPKRDQN
jgi:hypothetical protein